jgi:lipoate-protein ligase A
VERYIGGGSSLGEGAHPATSLSEEAGRRIDFEEARDAFARAFRDALGAEESRLSRDEERAAERIMTAKYATDAWNLAS